MDPTASPSIKNTTLVEDPEMYASLQRTIVPLTSDLALRDDLMQEGLIRLWQAECENPGRTRSWYLQNCRFCVLHWLALGRSVDSPKRATGTNRIPIDGVQDENIEHALHSDVEPLELVTFRDLVSVLSHHLTNRERIVLEGLANGLRLREVASQSNFSYPTALKCRRRIAALLSKLGVPEPLPQPNALARGRPSSNRAARAPRTRRPKLREELLAAA